MARDGRAGSRTRTRRRRLCGWYIHTSCTMDNTVVASGEERLQWGGDWEPWEGFQFRRNTPDAAAGADGREQNDSPGLADSPGTPVRVMQAGEDSRQAKEPW